MSDENTIQAAYDRASRDRNPEWARYCDRLTQMIAPNASAANNPLLEYINHSATAIRRNFRVANSLSAEAAPTGVHLDQENQAVESGLAELRQHIVANAYLGYTRATPIDLSQTMRESLGAGVQSAMSMQNPLLGAWEALKRGVSTLIFDNIPVVRDGLRAVNNYVGHALGHYLGRAMGRTEEQNTHLLSWNEAWRMAEAQHGAGLIGRGLQHFNGLNVQALQGILVNQSTFNLVAAPGGNPSPTTTGPAQTTVGVGQNPAVQAGPPNIRSQAIQAASVAGMVVTANPALLGLLAVDAALPKKELRETEVTQRP